MARLNEPPPVRAGARVQVFIGKELWPACCHDSSMAAVKSPALLSHLCSMLSYCPAPLDDLTDERGWHCGFGIVGWRGWPCLRSSPLACPPSQPHALVRCRLLAAFHIRLRWITRPVLPWTAQQLLHTTASAASFLVSLFLFAPASFSLGAQAGTRCLHLLWVDRPAIRRRLLSPACRPVCRTVVCSSVISFSRACLSSRQWPPPALQPAAGA